LDGSNNSINHKNIQKMKKITKSAVVMLGALTLFSSCNHDNICIRGNNHIETEEFNLDDFESVELDGAFDVNIKQGRNFEVLVTGDDNILPDVDAYVSNGTLKLDLKSGCYKNYDLHFDITMPHLHGVHLDGSGNIDVYDFDNQDFLNAHIDGSGNIDIHEFNGVTEILSRIDGSGNIRFNDEIRAVDDAEAVVNGSGDIKAFNVKADHVVARIAGSGNIKITAFDNLDATITGSGDIFYRGNPTIHQRITGSGNVNNSN
jgi:hypothetical protein